MNQPRSLVTAQLPGSGVFVSVSPIFVKDIQCAEPAITISRNTAGNPKDYRMYSLIKHQDRPDPRSKSGGPGGQGLIIKTHPKFVARVNYPRYNEALFKDDTGNVKLSQGLIIKTHPKFVAGVTYPRYNETPFTDDSLVTNSLLQLTSYGGDSNKSNKFRNQEFQENLDSEDEDFTNYYNEKNGQKMSFEDLGKIYKSISRKRILSKVQCSNIHFHAHADGRTTIHNHRTCRTDSTLAYSDDEVEDHSSDEVEEEYQREMYMKMKPINSSTTKKANNEFDFGKSGETYQRNEDHTRPHLYPTQESFYITGDNNYQKNSDTEDYLPNQNGVAKKNYENNNNYARNNDRKNLDRTSSKELCHCEKNICKSDNGVKFNPFFVRELHGNGTDNKSGTIPRDSASGNGNTGGGEVLCSVLLDCVIHSGRIAGIHARAADCVHCGEFYNKFQADLRAMTTLNDFSAYHTEKKDFTTIDMDKHLRELATVGSFPNRGANHQTITSSNGICSKRVGHWIKGISYAAVVALALVLLVVVIIVLIMFFNHPHP